MTLLAQFQAAPMTAADRMEALMDAVTRYQSLDNKVQNLIDAKDKAELDAGFTPLSPNLDFNFDLETADQEYLKKMDTPSIRQLSDALDHTVEAIGEVQEEVLAWAVILLGDGSLEYCRESLANREALLRAVENLGGDTQPILPSEQKVGFFNLGAAKDEVQRIKQARQARRKAWRAQPVPIITWRDIERVLIPGYLISRAIRAVTPRLPMVGPEVAKWLEQQDAQLSGKAGETLSQNWWTRGRLALVRWLLQAPDSEPQATEEAPHGDQVSRSFGHDRLDLLKDISGPVPYPHASSRQYAAKASQSPEGDPPVRPDHTAPGAH